LRFFNLASFSSFSSLRFWFHHAVFSRTKPGGAEDAAEEAAGEAEEAAEEAAGEAEETAEEAAGEAEEAAEEVAGEAAGVAEEAAEEVAGEAAGEAEEEAEEEAGSCILELWYLPLPVESRIPRPGILVPSDNFWR
jgi:hypothetical protein